MTADELRRLAAAIGETQYPAIRGATHEQRQQAAGYLRACADALEAGPVAMGWRSQDGEVADCISIEEAGRNGAGAYTVPLYPLAMPAQAQPLRLPEPMTDAELTALWDAGVFTALRRTEAETLRRIKEVNK